MWENLQTEAGINMMFIIGIEKKYVIIRNIGYVCYIEIERLLEKKIEIQLCNN